MGLLLALVAPLQARARLGGGAGGALDHLGQLARGLGLVPHDLVGLVVQELARGISLPPGGKKDEPHRSRPSPGLGVGHLGFQPGLHAVGEEPLDVGPESEHENKHEIILFQRQVDGAVTRKM